MQRAEASYPPERNRMNRAGQLAWFADAYARAGDVETGLALVAQAQAELARTGARFMSSELRRLEGELLLKLDGSRPSEAEASFAQAIALARTQEAKSLELGATVSLSRLLLEDGRGGEAQDILTAVYASFSEGFETPDLRAARELLQELSASLSACVGSASRDI
jgi:adenylate cyclase